MAASKSTQASVLRVVPDKLDAFKGYQKARELFEFVIEDFSPLARNPVCGRLVSQQVASADSICANIEEGFGRGSKKEFALFLGYARGSARETRGRYERMHHWIAADLIVTRVLLCSEVIAILVRTMVRLRG